MATHSSILAWRIPMDRGACQATAHRVAKSWAQLKRFNKAQHKVYSKIKGKVRKTFLKPPSLTHSKCPLYQLPIRAAHCNYYNYDCTLTHHSHPKPLVHIKLYS